MKLIEQNIARLREDTPGCRQRIHFNNAGAALSPTAVTHAMLDHLALEQRIGGSEAAAEAEADVRGLHREFARLLNCGAHEIGWAESAPAAWNTHQHAGDTPLQYPA